MRICIYLSDLEKSFCPFRSASDVAMATKQLRTVLEKGKTSLTEVDRKVHWDIINCGEFQFPIAGGAHIQSARKGGGHG